MSNGVVVGTTLKVDSRAIATLSRKGIVAINVLKQGVTEDATTLIATRVDTFSGTRS